MLALTSASALSSINWLRLLTGCRSFSRYVSHVLDGIYSNLCILLPIDLGAPAPAWDSYFRIIYFEFYWFYHLLNLTLHSTTDKSSRVQGSVLSKILFFILKILYSQKCSQLVALLCDHHDDSKLIFVMKYWDKWKYLFQVVLCYATLYLWLQFFFLGKWRLCLTLLSTLWKGPEISIILCGILRIWSLSLKIIWSTSSFQHRKSSELDGMILSDQIQSKGEVHPQVYRMYR